MIMLRALTIVCIKKGCVQMRDTPLFPKQDSLPQHPHTISSYSWRGNLAQPIDTSRRQIRKSAGGKQCPLVDVPGIKLTVSSVDKLHISCLVCPNILQAMELHTIACRRIKRTFTNV